MGHMWRTLTPMTEYTNSWMRHGACSGEAILHTELIDKAFFPHKGRPASNPLYNKYCGPCVSSTKCLKYALAHELDGVWGNTTRSQRETLPRNLILEVIQEAIVEGWYEPKMVVEIAVSPLLDLTLHMMQLGGELTQDDFVFEFEWIEYQQRSLQTVESFEEPPVE